MDADRLTYDEAIQAIKNNYPPANYTILREALDIAIELMQNADQQQAEIERLNKICLAYENALKFVVGEFRSDVAKSALAYADRIKDGEQP